MDESPRAICIHIAVARFLLQFDGWVLAIPNNPTIIYTSPRMGKMRTFAAASSNIHLRLTDEVSFRNSNKISLLQPNIKGIACEVLALKCD